MADCSQYESLISHKNRIKELEDTLVHVLERIADLEKRDGVRTRQEHAQEMAMDFRDSAGLSRAGIEY